jgi:transcriptional regulator with XRE-family HTH domain
MEDFSMITTGERIRARRKEIGMTVDTLAEKVGVNRTTIIRYENGFIEKMPINTLVPIARALNTTVAYLMGWDDEKNPALEIEDGIEKEAMHYFDSLPESQKLEALNYLRYLSESTKKR